MTMPQGLTVEVPVRAQCVACQTYLYRKTSALCLHKQQANPGAIPVFPRQASVLVKLRGWQT